MCEMSFVQAIRRDQFDKCKLAFSVSIKDTVDATYNCSTPVSLARCRVVKTNRLKNENKGNRGATKQKKHS